MINFKEEINKYKPVLVLDEVSEAIHSDEVRDVMDLLQRITEQLNTNGKE